MQNFKLRVTESNMNFRKITFISESELEQGRAKSNKTSLEGNAYVNIAQKTFQFPGIPIY